MISFIKGNIRDIYRESSLIELDVSGVGYEIIFPVFVMETILEKDLSIGDNMTFEVYYHATERSPKPLLVGFLNKLEKNFFEKIIQVEGVGPIKAVSALIFPVRIIAQAIENEDLTVLTQMPGIGSRAAQKIIATLKGKLFEIISGTHGAKSEKISEDLMNRDQALGILKNLGFKETEALKKITDVLNSQPELGNDVEDLIREIFKEKAT